MTDVRQRALTLGDPRQRALTGSLTQFLRDRGMRVGLIAAARELRAAVGVVLRESGQHVPRSGDGLDAGVAPPALVAQLRVYLRAASRIASAAGAAREIEEALGDARKACGLEEGGDIRHVLTPDPIAFLPDHLAKRYRLKGSRR